MAQMAGQDYDRQLKHGDSNPGRRIDFSHPWGVGDHSFLQEYPWDASDDITITSLIVFNNL